MHCNYVVLWFDTEDYITPESDDALLALLHILSQLNVRATFKFVGERARVLKRRGRWDVIGAIRNNSLFDVGYHTDYHSVHPTVAEYLEGRSWDDGIEEFDARERDGMEAVHQLFNKPLCCYGQPGGSWAPHVYAVLHRWHIPLYLDEGGHIGLDDHPFWYCGILNIFRMRSNCTRINWSESNRLQKAIERFDAIHKRLLDEGGGIISIFFHECEFSTERFWDVDNFARGANPPRQQWKAPPLLDADEVHKRFSDFTAYIQHIHHAPACKFITGWDAVHLMHDDARVHGWTTDEILELASKLQREITFHRIGNYWLSAAEAFWLITRSLVHWTALKRLPAQLHLPNITLMGPKERIATEPLQLTLSVDAIAHQCIRVHYEMDECATVPDVININGARIAPADFLNACANALLQLHANRIGAVEIQRCNLTAERYAGDERHLWGWIIFPENFTAPSIMELARLQCWTLKPATGFQDLE